MNKKGMYSLLVGLAALVAVVAFVLKKQQPGPMPEIEHVDQTEGELSAMQAEDQDSDGEELGTGSEAVGSIEEGVEGHQEDLASESGSQSGEQSDHVSLEELQKDAFLLDIEDKLSDLEAAIAIYKAKADQAKPEVTAALDAGAGELRQKIAEAKAIADKQWEGMREQIKGQYEAFLSKVQETTGANETAPQAAQPSPANSL